MINKNNGIVVYTALLGDYDFVVDPLVISAGVDYVMFTDKKKVASNVWTPVKPPIRGDSPRRTARYLKAAPHKFFPSRYKVWIWIDANILIFRDIVNVALKALKQHHLAAFPHPRNCAYSEARACHRLSLDRRELITAQIKAMQSIGFPKNAGLVETPVVIRRNTLVVRRFNNLWYWWLKNHCQRDQVSANCAAWMLGLEWKYLRFAINNNDFCYKLPHKLKEKRS